MMNSGAAFTRGDLPQTAVFIDYESWMWALFNIHGETPDIMEVLGEIKTRGQLVDLFVFGDFTKEHMQDERTKLRSITNNIIDCAGKGEKEYTDFIMLDHIYQKIIKQPDIKQYILVTGDGHFHSVVAFLKNFLDKSVGIFAVEGSFSAQLKSSASWYVEIGPASATNSLRPKVLQNILWAEQRGFLPSFSGTAKAASKYFNEDQVKVSAALKSLITAGYITQEVRRTDEGREVMALVVDWGLVKKHGLYDPNSNW